MPDEWTASDRAPRARRPVRHVRLRWRFRHLRHFDLDAWLVSDRTLGGGEQSEYHKLSSVVSGDAILVEVRERADPPFRITRRSLHLAQRSFSSACRMVKDLTPDVLRAHIQHPISEAYAPDSPSVVDASQLCDGLRGSGPSRRAELRLASVRAVRRDAHRPGVPCSEPRASRSHGSCYPFTRCRTSKPTSACLPRGWCLPDQRRPWCGCGEFSETGQRPPRRPSRSTWDRATRRPIPTTSMRCRSADPSPAN